MGTVPRSLSLCCTFSLKKNTKVRYHSKWADVAGMRNTNYHSRVTNVNGRNLCSCGADWNAVIVKVLSSQLRYGPTIALGKLEYVFHSSFGCCDQGRVGITEWRARVETEVAKIPDFSTFL